jgi:hypothetical protein
MTEIKDLIANGLNHSLDQISSELFYLQENLSHLEKLYGKRKIGKAFQEMSLGEKQKLEAKIIVVQKSLEKITNLLQSRRSY